MERRWYAIKRQLNRISAIESATPGEDNDTQPVNLNNTLHSLVGYSDIHKSISSVVDSRNDRVKIRVVCGSGFCIGGKEGGDGVKCGLTYPTVSRNTR